MQLEEKLALIQQMRRHEQRNYQRLGGSGSSFSGYKAKEDLRSELWSDKQVCLFSSSFRLRFLLAAFLFLLFFYMDIQQISFGGLDSSRILSYISETVSLPDSGFMMNKIN